MRERERERKRAVDKMSGKMVLSSACSVIIWFAMINIGCVFQAKSEVRVGPWGGQGGNLWTYEPKGEMSNIKVTYDDVIHSVCFTSIDQDGNLDKSKFPCKEAAKTAEINIDVKNEKLNGISGTFDATDKCSKTITSLSFTTSSNKTYGPFGTVKGTSFSLVVENQGFTGFHGSTGELVDSIGVSLGNPSIPTIPTIPTTEDVGPWGGPGGENRYDYLAKGEISRIAIKYEGGIRSIIITSEDENGVLYTSRRIGGAGGDYSEEDEIVLDTKNGERLVGISGTFGNYLTFLVITSLKFYTNKGRTFGPYGGGEGTAFSYMAESKYITGFYGGDGGLLDSIGLHLQAEPDIPLGNPSIPTTEDVGTWGGPGGENRYDYMAKGEISRIAIKYEAGIRSIIITSEDENGVLYTSRRIGGAGGDYSKVDEIVLDIKNGERLVGISGTVGIYMSFLVITSLKFYTNTGRTFGPYGGGEGTPFSYMAENKYITGFYGGDGGLLDSIGLHLQAEPVITLGEWGNTTAGRPWSYQPTGGISHISITYKDAIYSITFTSVDGNGTTNSSKKFGKDTGIEKAKIDIDPKNEKLSGISGTVGDKKGQEVITSLTFYTDNNRTFGPFGTETTGTAFSVPLKNGFISGFHGRSLKWVHAIGLYVNPA